MIEKARKFAKDKYSLKPKLIQNNLKIINDEKFTFTQAAAN